MKEDLKSIWLYFALSEILFLCKMLWFHSWSWWLVTFPLWIIAALMTLFFAIRFMMVFIRIKFLSR